LAIRYWVGNGGKWSEGIHWAASSGGAGYASVPHEGDTVIFDANSITIPGQTITIDVNNVPALDFSNVLHDPVISIPDYGLSVPDVPAISISTLIREETPVEDTIELSIPMPGISVIAEIT